MWSVFLCFISLISFSFCFFFVDFDILLAGGTFGELALESGRDWGPPEKLYFLIRISALNILIIIIGQDKVFDLFLEGVITILTSIPVPVTVSQ